jgi:hypothetical protein
MFTILSAFDERARPKGSRDPLGAEAVWSFLGRKIVGNLTTVTGRLDNFIVALLCCNFAQVAPDARGVQERYLRFEQLAAYLKLCERDGNDGVLGITRARANFTRTNVPLGASEAAQLLADQASYGLWGLYSSALEGAGLIEGERRRPTAAGHALIAQITAHLGKRLWDDLCTLALQKQAGRERFEQLAPGFVAMLDDAPLRATVVHALLARQKNCVLQGELFKLANAYLDETTEHTIEHFCDAVLQPGAASADMQAMLRRIRDLDPVLKRADLVMAWLQGSADEELTELASTLAPHLAGVAPDATWSDLRDLPYRAFLEEFHDACVRGAADAAIAAVLAQNKRVMAARGGAAWLETDAGRRLVVRVRNDLSLDLANVGPAVGPWRHTYFLGSFLAICREGRA